MWELVVLSMYVGENHSVSTGCVPEIRSLYKDGKNYSILYVTMKNFALLVASLQMHCTENLNQIFPEMKLRGLVPNFYIHVFMSDFHIHTIAPQMQHSKIGALIVGIYKSLTDTWM